MLDYASMLSGVLTDFFHSVNSSIGAQAALVAGAIGLNILWRWLRRSYEEWRADNDSSYGRY